MTPLPLPLGLTFLATVVGALGCLVALLLDPRWQALPRGRRIATAAGLAAALAVLAWAGWSSVLDWAAG